MEKDLITFSGKVDRQLYQSDNYRVYVIIDDNKNKDIKKGSYGTVTISGDINQLDIGVNYTFVGIEEKNKYGYSYNIVNIRRDKPIDFETTYEFLSNILTYNQAKVLFNNYPDIIDKVLNENLEDIDFNLLKGITIKKFDKIKNKIIENFSLIDLVSEFKGYISMSVIKKLYEKYVSIEMIREKLRDDPYYCFCSLSGIGFKTADDILLKLQENNIISFGYNLLDSKQRCMASIIYVLEEDENNGNTRSEVVILREKCSTVAKECLMHFTDCLKDDEFIFYKQYGNNLYASRKATYETERYIANVINDVLIDNLAKDDKRNINIDKYRLVDNFELSDEQIESINNTFKYKISLLTGNAGSGKSYSTISSIKAMDDNNFTYLLLAPTGKASKVLSKYTKKNAMTIHRALGFRPPDNQLYNSNNKLKYDFIIVDEFSMVDIFLFKKLISAIDFNRTHLMFIGDHAQLPSVSCGNLLHDFINSNKIPTVSLSKIFRYGEGGLMKVATDIRNSKEYLNNLSGVATLFGDKGDYTFVNVDQEQSLKQLLALYSKLLETYHPEDIMVITAYKKNEYGSIKLNSYLQKLANAKHVDDKIFMTSAGRSFYLDDMVIQTVNDYKVEKYVEWDSMFDKGLQSEVFVANGEVGVIEGFEDGGCIINFDGVKCLYSKNKLLNIDLAYAMTIHKSQGSGCKVVIVFNPKAHTYMLNSNLLYVGITRTKEKCFHISTSDVIDRAIKKKANLERETWMLDLLKTNH